MQSPHGHEKAGYNFFDSSPERIKWIRFYFITEVGLEKVFQNDKGSREKEW